MIMVEHVEVQPAPNQAGYSAFASDLGLEVGDWPHVLSATDAAGEGFELKRGKQITAHAEFNGFVYEGGGYKLSVFND